MKKSALLLTILTALALTGCGNTTATTSATTSKASTVAPSSSVAEVKDDYVAIGGLTPYEVLTATQEQAIKKAEEEARLQAEAKAKADAEVKAKAQAEAKKQAEQQAQASQQEVAEQPQQTAEVQQAEQPAQTASTGHDYTTPAPAGQHWYTFPSGQRVLVYDTAYLAHKNAYEHAKSKGDELGMKQAQAMMEHDLATGEY